MGLTSQFIVKGVWIYDKITFGKKIYKIEKENVNFEFDINDPIIVPEDFEKSLNPKNEGIESFEGEIEEVRCNEENGYYYEFFGIINPTIHSIKKSSSTSSTISSVESTPISSSKNENEEKENVMLIE